MAKRTLTPNQELWKKEIRRIERFQKRASKRGYYFPETIIPETPKRITKKALQRLKNITPEEQYKQASYLTKTGELISGTEGRKQERSEASKKGWRARRYTADPKPKDYKNKQDEPKIDEPKSKEEPKAEKPKSKEEPKKEEPKKEDKQIRLPMTSRIEGLTRALEELEFGNEDLDREYSPQKRNFIETWKRTIERFKDRLDVLERYIISVDNRLTNCMQTIIFLSDEYKVANAVSELARLINYDEPLTTEELKGLEQHNPEISFDDYDLPYEHK